mgnify:CR=1 FL=1
MSTVVSFRADDALVAALDELARATHRDRPYHLRQALAQNVMLEGEDDELAYAEPAPAEPRPAMVPLLAKNLRLFRDIPFPPVVLECWCGVSGMPTMARRGSGFNCAGTT